MLPAEVVKHIFAFVPGNDHIVLTKVCHYWNTLLSELPIEYDNIHQNSYQLYQNCLSNGTDIIYSYQYTESPYCLNLYMDCIYRHNFYDGEESNSNVVTQIWKDLFLNIVYEGHTFSTKKESIVDIMFVKKYLDTEDYYYVERGEQESYKILYKTKYSELLTECILYKHIFTKYLLLLSVKPNNYIKVMKEQLFSHHMTVHEVIEDLYFLFGFNILSIPMFYRKLLKGDYPHKEEILSYVGKYIHDTNMINTVTIIHNLKSYDN